MTMMSSTQGWLVRIVLATTVVATPVASAVAQGGQDDARSGAASFAGGQMVRGTVTASAADHLTVKTDAGDVYQVAISANTRLMKERQPVKLADIKAGDGVGAMGVLDPATKTVHAVFVTVVDAEQVKKARENMGKTYITGKVTAIDLDGLKITVERPDGVSQVIAVDENTSFKRGGRGMAAMATGAGVVDVPTGQGQSRGNGAGASAGAGGSTGGESITFADVKVGDSIVGRGGLKNGVFVPTELGVMTGGMGQRRRRTEGASPAATGTAAPAATTPPPTPPTTPQ
jgi:predicted RNA-binding protein